MHDASGKKLEVGDHVLIMAKVTELHAMEDFCVHLCAETKGRGSRPARV